MGNRKRRYGRLSRSVDDKRKRIRKAANKTSKETSVNPDVVQLPDSSLCPLDQALDRLSEISSHDADAQPCSSRQADQRDQLQVLRQSGTDPLLLNHHTSSQSTNRRIGASRTAESLADGAPSSFSSVDPNVDSELSDPESSHPYNDVFSSTFGPGFESEQSDDSDDEDSERIRNRCPARNYENISVPSSNIGSMDVECIDCKAFHFAGKVLSKCGVGPKTARFTQCCGKGKVELPLLPEPPRLLKTLLEGNHVLSKHFGDNIRKYNSSLAFASMVAARPQQRPGPYSYIVHGQVYHNTGCLAGDDPIDSQYAQLYVLDSDFATELRMRRNQMVLSESLLKEITQIMYNVNVLAQSYQMMQSVVEQNGDTGSEVVMVFDESKHQGSRRHNAAAANQIAAVFVSNDGEVPVNRALVVRPKGKEIRRISVLSPFLDPMVYPILFPRGERGWSPKLTLKNGKRLSLLQYYAYRLGYRRGSFLHLSGKLFQQYIVDAYCKIEENNLNYVKLNQKKLRAESYRGLMDHLADQAAEQNASVGKRVILPSTFTGSPRSMNQHYQDAMRMVSRFGRPDLFLTFTCNPSWPEIINELNPGEKANDRPDLIARVFKMKLDSLLDDLLKKNVLGRVMAHVGVIEFQKRGLPHVHLLLTLHPDDKIRTRKQMDDLIWAEIPGENDPVLREKVLRHMIHGPCGDDNPNSPCMEGEKCNHNYPKNLSNDSHLSRKGFPVYRRRDGTTAQVGRFEVGNEWVVPYNPYLLQRYDAHINLELCASVKSVKYLYKYIYKGHDAASLKFTAEGDILDYDEVQQFLEARYVSSHEACWRIFRFPMQLKSHSIIRLAVHEEDQQSIVFEPGQEEEAVDRATERYTTLTGFFALNSLWADQPLSPRNSEDPRNYRYIEIPEKFTFKPASGWSPRKQGDTEIGRMYFVSPEHVEKFHLRLLLLHTKGATSFESLRTVNGETHTTFKQACEALGLVEMDNELDETLTEACTMYSAGTVRQVFADILAGCIPNDPEGLWNKFKDHMTDDFIHRGMSPEQAEATAYAQIKTQTDLQHIHIEQLIPVPPNPPVDLPEDSAENIAAASRETGTTMYASLNGEQKNAADGILAASGTDGAPKSFFVDGPGGSGKTYLYKTLYHMFLGSGKKVLNVAWSGIAAQLLIEGRTCHSAFSLPVPITRENFMPTMKVNSNAAQTLRECDVIIWDEAPMAPKYAVEGVDLLLKDIMGNDELFGGKVLLFGGDFRQIPPIVKEKHNSAVIEATLKRSHIWKHLTKYALAINVRAQNSDESFRQFLVDVGNGKAQKDDDGFIQIPAHVQSSGDLVKEIYGDDISLLSTKELAERAILALKNADCDKLNDQVLNILAGALRIYFSRDEAVSDDSAALYPIEFLHELTPSGMPKHELRLKPGCIVMLLRNLNVKKGLCNGTRMIVSRLNEFTIECRAVETGQIVVLPRITLTPCDTELPFTLKRRQFPIRLCFSMTVNKSQGQSFEKVGVYLPAAPFSHGQLYVALSRCRSADGLKVLAPENRTKNIILHELLKLA